MEVILDKANQYHQLPNGKFRRLAVDSEYIHRMQRRHFLLFDALPLIGAVAAVALAFYRPIGAMEISLFAALWREHAHFPPRVDGESVGEKTAPANLVGKQHELRRRFVVVELGDERLQHLFRAEALVGPGEVGAVTPVMAGAEEKHLNAGLARVLMGGEQVGLFEGLWIDALMGLNMAQRRQAIAEARGTLVILLPA